MYPENEIDEFVRKELTGSELGAHTYDHTKRVLSIAREICEVQHADMRILCAAALLHDVGRPYEMSTGKSHALLSGEMSKEVLQRNGYNEDEISRVVDAIRTHRYSEGLTPNSLEGEILSDADKLDAIGAIGIFRAIAQASVSNRGIQGFLTHAEEKLLKLKGMMHTEHAKRLAEQRHSVLQEFVSHLQTEYQEEFISLNNSK
ncbi:MAG: HD domain-containing protein [Candidatus Thorarchaeota archaeon]|jgi:uncharacterized protein